MSRRSSATRTQGRADGLRMAGARQAELQPSICMSSMFRWDILDLKVFLRCRDQWDFSATALGGEKSATGESPGRAPVSWEAKLCPAGLLHTGLSCLVSPGHQKGPLCPPASDSGNIKEKLSLKQPDSFPSESEGPAQKPPTR